MEIACPNSPGEGSNFMGLWTDCAIKRAFFFTRSAGDASDDHLMNLPSFLEAFASIISQLSQVSLITSYCVLIMDGNAVDCLGKLVSK